MIGRVLALGASMILIAAGAARAQDEEEEEYSYEKETSPYAEIYGAAAYFLINDHDGGEDWSGGAGAIVGAHLVQYLAMEGQYEYQNYSNSSLATYNLKGVVPLGRFHPYLKAGMGLMAGRPNHPFLFMGRAEVGLTVFLNEQWALRGGLGWAGAKHNNHLLQGNAGVAYYFE